MPCRQSLIEEFIERRVKGKEERKGNAERKKKRKKRQGRAERKGVGGACLLRGPLHLHTYVVI